MRAWLKKEGFLEGDLRSAHSSLPYLHPTGHACHKGELNVCKWLHAHGAAPDITKANKNGITPMFMACIEGHLSVCKWLFEVGAAADITKVDMWSITPMHAAYYNGQLSVCKWLVFNGALNTPSPAQHDDGHVDQAIVKSDTHPGLRGDKRPVLLAWAQDLVAIHHTFLHVVLRASVVLPDSHQQVSPNQRCHLPRLPRVVLERLGDLLGVEMGRRVRNVREFAEVLAVVIKTQDA